MLSCFTYIYIYTPVDLLDWIALTNASACTWMDYGPAPLFGAFFFSLFLARVVKTGTGALRTDCVCIIRFYATKGCVRRQ